MPRRAQPRGIAKKSLGPAYHDGGNQGARARSDVGEIRSAPVLVAYLQIILLVFLRPRFLSTVEIEMVASSFRIPAGDFVFTLTPARPPLGCLAGQRHSQARQHSGLERVLHSLSSTISP